MENRILRWHKVFLTMLPQIVNHARLAFRDLRPEARGEAVQEVVCNALKAFVRLVQLKKVSLAYPSVLAGFGVRQVKDHRKVGGHLNINDVTSRYCQVNKGVRVGRIDQYDETEDEWTQLVIEDRTAGPAEIAAPASTSTHGLNRFRAATAASLSTSVLATAPAMPPASSK